MMLTVLLLSRMYDYNQANTYQTKPTVPVIGCREQTSMTIQTCLLSSLKFPLYVAISSQVSYARKDFSYSTLDCPLRFFTHLQLREAFADIHSAGLSTQSVSLRYSLD